MQTITGELWRYRLEVDLQVLEIDPGASKGVSFTPGLKLSIDFDYP